MNIERIKAAEKAFLVRYPGGFDNEEMIAIAKKHRGPQMSELARQLFASDRFSFANEVCENIIKVVTKSSMISIFEKPKLRDYVRGLGASEKEVLAQGLFEQLHGDKVKGFYMMLDILVRGQLAKWSIMTILPYYFYPTQEVFIKPTTCKNIIVTFELSGLKYNPRPSYEFYEKYKEQFIEMKRHVGPQIGQDNAAFSGFLMIVMEGFE